MREEFQRELVNKLRAEKKSYKEIGVIINLSRHVVRKLHTYKRVCHPKKKRRKPNFKSPEKLAIKRCILGKKVNASVIKNECQIKESTRTIQRHLAKIGMTYVSVKMKIFLTKQHKQKRVEMVKKWLSEDHNWNRTIFGDEKRFTLDVL